MTDEIREGGWFIAAELPCGLSRTQGTLAASSGAVVAGTVLGRDLTGAVSVAAGGSNTGDGTMAATPTIGNDAVVGEYTLNITAAASDAGEFELIDPDGDIVGTGDVASAFTSSHLNFTLQDGAADFIVGDTFTITVAEEYGSYAPLDLSATDGTQHVAGVAIGYYADSASTQKIAVLANNANVKTGSLTYPAGATAAQITNIVGKDGLGGVGIRFE